MHTSLAAFNLLNCVQDRVIVSPFSGGGYPHCFRLISDWLIAPKCYPTNARTLNTNPILMHRFFTSTLPNRRMSALFTS